MVVGLFQSLAQNAIKTLIKDEYAHLREEILEQVKSGHITAPLENVAKVLIEDSSLQQSVMEALSAEQQTKLATLMKGLKLANLA